jgi:hypothetical protein
LHPSALANSPPMRDQRTVTAMSKRSSMLGGLYPHVKSPSLFQIMPTNAEVPYFFAAFCFAQRSRWASAIFFLPAADMVLLLGAVGDLDVRGRPLRLVEAVPARRERADCRRVISASMAERMSCVFISIRYQRAGLISSYVLFYIQCDASVLGPNRHQYTWKPFVY